MLIYKNSLWVVVGHFGLLWIVVDRFGSLWIVLDRFGSLWIVLIIVGHFNNYNYYMVD